MAPPSARSARFVSAPSRYTDVVKCAAREPGSSSTPLYGWKMREPAIGQSSRANLVRLLGGTTPRQLRPHVHFTILFHLYYNSLRSRADEGNMSTADVRPYLPGRSHGAWSSCGLSRARLATCSTPRAYCACPMMTCHFSVGFVGLGQRERGLQPFPPCLRQERG